MPKTTTRDRILSHLASRGEATNGEMARDLDLPEASIRRTTLQMEDAGKLQSTLAKYGGNQLTWRLAPTGNVNLADGVEYDTDPEQVTY